MERITLWRGLILGFYPEAEAHTVISRPLPAIQEAMRGHHTVGIHWTDNPNSAYNFATDRDPDGWAHEGDIDSEDEWVMGFVLEAEVDPHHILEIDSEEWEGYAMSDAIFDRSHGEQEVTVRADAPVTIVGCELVWVSPESGESSKTIPMRLSVRAGLGDLDLLLKHPALVEVAKRFKQARIPLYVVGGPVRDLFHEGHPGEDLDLTTPADVQTIRRLLSGLGSIDPSGEKYGTVRLYHKLPDGETWVIEITQHRKEKYRSGDRKPITVGTEDLREDQSRRDFRMNTMVLDMHSGEVHDPFGGMEDLAKGRLSTPLDPVVTFTDDPLRIVRMVRFSATKGMKPDKVTLDAVRKTRHELVNVSVERKRMELEKVLKSTRPAALTIALDLSLELGIAQYLFGGIDVQEAAKAHLESLKPQDRLAALAYATGSGAKSALFALTFTNAAIDHAVTVANIVDSVDNDNARWYVRHHSDEELDSAQRVAQAYGRRWPSEMGQARSMARELRRPLPVTGHDAPEGVKGRDIGAWLNRVEQAFLENPGLTQEMAKQAFSAPVPMRVRAEPPKNFQAPRPVKLDPRAEGDIRNLDTDDEGVVRDVLKLIERGKADLERKERPPLEDCFSVDAGHSVRILMYLHVDGSWHVFYVGYHDYNEAEDRLEHTGAWMPEALWDRAVEVARQKIRQAAPPTAEDRRRHREMVEHQEHSRSGGDGRGNNQDRARRQEKLLDEFGDGRRAPCLMCGKILTEESVTADRIWPGVLGGTYRYENVVPMCWNCNAARPDIRLTVKDIGLNFHRTAALKMRFQDQGKEGRHDHITYEEVGTVPIEVVKYMLGARGENPGGHRNMHGEVWDEFKADIKANGIQNPIFITVDWNQKPQISEGNHRRDAALELGFDEVPVTVRYFGCAERQGLLLERHGGTPKTAAASLSKEQQRVIDAAVNQEKSMERGKIYVGKPDDFLPNKTTAATIRVLLGLGLIEEHSRSGYSTELVYGPFGRGYHSRGVPAESVYKLTEAGWAAGGSPKTAAGPGVLGWLDTSGHMLDLIWHRDHPGGYEAAWDQHKVRVIVNNRDVLQAEAQHVMTDAQVDALADFINQKSCSRVIIDFQGRAVDKKFDTKYDAEKWMRSWKTFEKAAALSLENVISVAEHRMEELGLAGKTLHIPMGHRDDPEYQAAIKPWVEMVRRLTGDPHLRFYATDYPFGGTGMYDGNSIRVRPTTNELVLFHEIAHAKVDIIGERGHTPEFVRVVRDLYTEHISPEAGQVFWDIVGLAEREGVKKEAIVMGVPVVKVRTEEHGWSRGFVSDERPVLAYRGFGSWDELKDALRMGYWKATPVFTVRGEGDTQMALRLPDVLKGSRFHPLRGTGFLAIMEADIRGLPWASFMGPLDDPNILQGGRGLYVNPATNAGVMYPDLGLGIGIVGSIPLDRIKTIYEVENRQVVRSWPFKEWESHIDRVKDKQDWSPRPKIKVSYPVASKKALVHALTMNQDRTICGIASYRLNDVKRKEALIDASDLWTRPEAVRNFWGKEGDTFSIRESQRCPKCLPSMWEAEQLHRVAAGKRWSVKEVELVWEDWCLATGSDPNDNYAFAYWYEELKKNPQYAPPMKFVDALEQKRWPGGPGISARVMALVMDPNNHKKKFKEKEHPRGQPGNSGEFRKKDTSAPAQQGEQPEQPAQEQPKQDQPQQQAPQSWVGQNTSGAGTEEDPVSTDNVEDAANALAQGLHVELQQPKQISSLLDKLADEVEKAKAAGEKYSINLCNVTAKGTNLFCTESLGIPRIKMPQLKVSDVEPGSKAEREVQKTERGEYDLQPLFLKKLQAEGYKTETTQEKAYYLKASQSELNGAKVAGMTDAILAGKSLGNEPIFVSNDDYIVDGHHRWAATVAADFADGNPTDLSLPIHRIDIDIITLLDMANKFAAEYGATPKAASRVFIASSEMPKYAPETSPIPPGHYRLFHRSNERNADSIRRNGLDAMQSRQIDFTGNMVWGTCGFEHAVDINNAPSSGWAVVEYHVEWDPHADAPRPGGAYTSGSIPPKDIVFVWEPWHFGVWNLVQIMQSDRMYKTLEDLDFLKSEGTGWTKALDWLKDHQPPQWMRTTKTSKLAMPPSWRRQRWYHATWHKVPLGTVLTSGNAAGIESNWGRTYYTNEGNEWREDQLWLAQSPRDAHDWASRGTNEWHGRDFDAQPEPVFIYEVEPLGAVREDPLAMEASSYYCERARVVHEWTEAMPFAAKTAMPTSWRALTNEPWWLQYDAVISSEGGGSGRRAYEVYVHGKQVASRPTLAEAKAVIGPAVWAMKRIDPVKVEHYYFGETEEFTSPVVVWVAEINEGKVAAMAGLTFKVVPGRMHKGMEDSKAIEAWLDCSYVGYLRFDPTQALFEEIDVEPEYRRQGIASALVAELERRYRSRGYDWTRTTTTEDGAALVRGLGRDIPPGPDWA